jgi:ammonia channel protein AmtB
MDVSHDLLLTHPLSCRATCKQDARTSTDVRDRNWIQLGKQVAWCVVGFAWVFVVTYAIMFVINFIPGCKFRSSEEAEIVGMDVSANFRNSSLFPRTPAFTRKSAFAKNH